MDEQKGVLMTLLVFNLLEPSTNGEVTKNIIRIPFLLICGFS